MTSAMSSAVTALEVEGLRIAVREKSRAQLRIKASLDLAATNGFPSWVEVDPTNFKGVFKSLPDRAEFANDVNEQLVVELYSK